MASRKNELKKQSALIFAWLFVRATDINYSSRSAALGRKRITPGLCCALEIWICARRN